MYILPFITFFTLAACYSTPFRARQELSQETRSSLPVSSRLSGSWRRLSDSVIRKIWSFPPRHSGSNSHHYGGREWLPGAPASIVARYSHDMVIRFHTASSNEALALSDACDILFLDIWDLNPGWVDIRLSDDLIPSLTSLLPPSLHNAWTPMMRDLDLVYAVHDTYPSSSTSMSVSLLTGASMLPGRSPLLDPEPKISMKPVETSIFFDSYQPLAVIVPWMRLMQSLSPSHASVISVGTTHQGRDILALRVGAATKSQDGSITAAPRKTIIITGGTNAREWISVSTVAYLAYQLITTYGKSGATTALLDTFDFVFVPILNPDGYVHTWEHDRLWRKNRQPTPLRFCHGLDIDRSFSYLWNGGGRGSGDGVDKSKIDPSLTRTIRDQGPGTVSQSENPCSEFLTGSTPFEATEAASFAAWAQNQSEQGLDRFVGYIDLRSYGQGVLYPHSSSYNNDDVQPALEGLAQEMAKVMGSYSANSDGYKAARMETNSGIGTGGSALDWFHNKLDVAYTYQIKLRDTGSYGFLLPREQIVPTGKETLQAVLHLGQHLLDVYSEGEATKRICYYRR